MNKEIKKPEKKEMIDEKNCFCGGSVIDYNQACEEWEAYHKQEVKRILEGLKKIADILNEQLGDTDPDLYNEYEGRDMTEDEIKEEYPMFWASSNLTFLVYKAIKENCSSEPIYYNSSLHSDTDNNCAKVAEQELKDISEPTKENHD